MKKQHITLIVLAILALACLFVFFPRNGAVGPERENGLARVIDKKTINIAYIVFPPTITKDPNTQQLGGHFIRTAREIAAQAGLKPVFIETDWNGFAAGLNTRRFDISIAPTFVTIPRSMSVAFTDPLFYAGNGVIVRNGETRFTNIASFDRPEIAIAATQGSAAHEFIEKNFKRAKLRILPGADQFLPLQEVIAGRADAGFANAHDTANFVAKNPGKVRDLFKDDPYNLTPVSWAVASDQPEMLAFVNNALRALEAQGKLVEYERQAGARWLHPVREYRLTAGAQP